METKNKVLGLVECLENNYTIVDTHSKEDVKMASLVIAYQRFMDILGIPHDEHSKDTAYRVAKMFYYERCRALREEKPVLTTFPSNGYDQYIVINRIPFVSVCSHHHVSFSGTASIIYHPDKLIAGLSKFARIVEYFSAKPNIQENLTSEILEFLNAKLEPKGILVKLTAEHNCMTTRGVKAVGSVTVTQKILGNIDKVEAANLLET